METGAGSSKDLAGLSVQNGFFIHFLGASNGVAERTGAWLGSLLHVASLGVHTA